MGLPKKNFNFPGIIQGSLYYQPKQCTIKGTSPQIYHTFALFDPFKMGNLMIPVILKRAICQNFWEVAVVNRWAKSLHDQPGRTFEWHRGRGIRWYDVVGKVDDGDKFPELVGLVTWVVVSNVTNIFYFHPGPWGNDPNWLIFFNWVIETTN